LIGKPVEVVGVGVAIAVRVAVGAVVLVGESVSVGVRSVNVEAVVWEGMKVATGVDVEVRVAVGVDVEVDAAVAVKVFNAVDIPVGEDTGVTVETPKLFR
jgi:hypothetical protein